MQVLPVEDVVGGGGGVVTPMYGQQQQQQPGHGPSSTGYLPPAGANVGGGGSDGGEAFEALMAALRWQVEYYFSADNLVTDAYLRGLMDPEGFVAVSKIIVFNRVRSMTSDYSLLIEAMRRSSELEIMEQDHTGETRVRTRHSPLHWTREQLPPTKVLLTIPQEHQGLGGVDEEPYDEEPYEEEEEQEHHITFGNVEEVIGQKEPAERQE
ncbi:conserved unknown protein [Ectocarpus siliculosus]|uniref:HTH La-type RNA-binding domain-containing protein n=1 Tax=Ectocarpus siliculosus TaxID=2880 RepID=D7FJX9_ECTSI|nr:conserved unknown protein [Ectocarpus siliculosus]|eukprot:CBJ29227.1 conserved unknown protein [Ectocarpus siliculosus]